MQHVDEHSGKPGLRVLLGGVAATKKRSSVRHTWEIPKRKQKMGSGAGSARMTFRFP